ncbi:Serine-threonine/tyrosine-protein kinase, catalytic domain [Dillenia turbinata]|uniref:Serine-threonine/tyrosine-protein kinase, catalytic domain n=1 Tax=Dillenia turbinata TaxID=194707 RepID=A0AAN8UXE1_9MAGN
MVFISRFLSIPILIILIRPAVSQQSDDKSNSMSQSQVPGSNYICNSQQFPCPAFVVYRAKENQRNLSSIGTLFNTDIPHILSFNNFLGREIIVPVQCSCPDRFSEAIFKYNFSRSDSSHSVACGVYEGLVKVQSLIERNPSFGDHEDFPIQFVPNGSLRDCFSNASAGKQLTWTKRTQIAFDLAVGLHYLHYCIKPAYVHRNLNSRNVLISMDWRAKISGFEFARTLACSPENEEMSSCSVSEIVGKSGYLTLEYLCNQRASPKTDICALGWTLLELLSAREAVMDGSLLKDSIGFLSSRGPNASSGFLEKFNEFMDPAFEGNHPVADARCIAALATACIGDDAQQRLTMNDVIKTLSRIV